MNVNRFSLTCIPYGRGSFRFRRTASALSSHRLFSHSLALLPERRLSTPASALTVRGSLSSRMDSSISSGIHASHSSA